MLYNAILINRLNIQRSFQMHKSNWSKS